jgi:hypothetical protein
MYLWLALLIILSDRLRNLPRNLRILMSLRTPRALTPTLPSPSLRSPPRSARLRRSLLPPPRSRRRLMRRNRTLLPTSSLVTCHGTSTRIGSARSSRPTVSFLVFALSPTATLVAPAGKFSSPSHVLFTLLNCIQFRLCRVRQRCRRCQGLQLQEGHRD